ncbi:MAG: hypothetical protein MI784_18135 [Cytophagales bacterium]|nr:hypothetical protein [Cytophagales bacterium]
MKSRLAFSVFFVWLLITLACKPIPELSSVPSIEFLGLKNIVDDNGANLLQLIVAFEDGDGDLGLDEVDSLDYRYRKYVLVLDENGNPIRFGSRPGLPPFSGNDYFVIHGDTLLKELNENQFNFFVDLLVKNEDEVFEKIELKAALNGTFRRLSSEETPLEGEIKYGIPLNFYLNFYKYDEIKLKCYIKDRALNKSNEVLTPAFKGSDYYVE